MPTIQKWVRQEFMHFTCASSKRVENFMRWKSSKCFYACNSRIYAHNLLYLSTKEIHLHANRSCWSTVKVRARESTGTFYTNIKIHFVCSLCVQKLIQRESLALDIPGFYLLFPRFFFPVFYYASFFFYFRYRIDTFEVEMVRYSLVVHGKLCCRQRLYASFHHVPMAASHIIITAMHLNMNKTK